LDDPLFALHRTTTRFAGLVVMSGLAVGIIAPATATATAVTPAARAPLTPAGACALRGDVVRQSDPQLGSGVGLTTGHEGNLFPAGARTRLTISQPTAGPSRQQVHLSILTETRQVASRTVTLTRQPGQSAAATVQVPRRPGWYQVRAERIGHGRTLGVSCLWYGVAMPGASLNLDTLPAGKDWGGAGPLRDVALHSELGLDVVRFQINVAEFLDQPKYADPEITEAANRAHQLGLKFLVVIGQGGADETAAVKNDTWGHLVKRIVATYPAVRYWIPWNEPNSGECFYGSARTYVHKVLHPAAVAIHTTNSRAMVVGGSAVNDDTGWWRRFAALGGFRDLDVVGVHPYTNGLGAPESKGLLSVLKLVHHLAKAHGAAGKPILDSESAWPSAYPDVHANLTTQSDYVSRKLVIERSLGVDSGEYLLEGGWDDWDVIDYYRGVKPAAMAASASATLLGNRRFLGWVNTGIPHIWAARFSASKTDHRQLIATWSSAGTQRVHLSCGTKGFDGFGASKTFHGQLQATGSLTFVSVAAGSHCLS
jgi:hypothetical protein